jgi:hypothetical protein
MNALKNVAGITLAYALDRLAVYGSIVVSATLIPAAVLAVAVLGYAIGVVL